MFLPCHLTLKLEMSNLLHIQHIHAAERQFQPLDCYKCARQAFPLGESNLQAHGLSYMIWAQGLSPNKLRAIIIFVLAASQKKSLVTRNARTYFQVLDSVSYYSQTRCSFLCNVATLLSIRKYSRANCSAQTASELCNFPQVPVHRNIVILLQCFK